MYTRTNILLDLCTIKLHLKVNTKEKFEDGGKRKEEEEITVTVVVVSGLLVNGVLRNIT